MTGTAAGLIAGFVGLTVLSVALWVLAAGWGLVAAAAVWLVVAVLLTDVRGLYDRAA